MKQIFAVLALGAALIVTPAARGGNPELPLDLQSADDFVILAKTGINTVPSADITGDMGVSPITSTAITGFSLIMDSSGEFSTSAQVTGKIYAADYLVPTPTKMTTAISDMETAFTQASLRTIPDTTELMAGDISGLTITPGLHKWSTDVLVNSDVTLDAQGNANAIFIFQIAGDFLVASGQSVLLAAGAQAKNIFWQIEGPVGAVIGTTAHAEGVIMTAKAITLQTGASFNGKLFAQTRVDLDMNTIVDSSLINQYTLTYNSGLGGSVLGNSPQFVLEGEDGTEVTAVANLGFVFVGWTGTDPSLLNPRTDLNVIADITVQAQFVADQVQLEIASEHGIGLPPVGIYTNSYGTTLTNMMTDVETIGGTQYVNVGWSMIGNEPLTGITNAMSMVHTNDAVLTWLWTTNYYLNLTAVHGSITNETVGWKPAGWVYAPMPSADFGYLFDHWEVNGVNQGSGVPLSVTMNGAQNVVAIFNSDFVDVTTEVDTTTTWLFDPRKGYFIGTVKISNTHSQKVLMSPFWFEVKHTEWHWLRHPTGHDANTGMDYLDISAAINGQLPGIGNGDLILDQGESVTVTGIELMGRRTPTGLIMAVWADPPGLALILNPGTMDTDHDGIPDLWEKLHSDVLNVNNPFDAILDSDGDSMTSRDEYIAGTNPADPNSNFSIRPTPGTGIGVTWDGRSDRVYTVLTTHDLRQAFVAEPTNIVGTGRAIEYSKTDTLTRGAKGGSDAVFYRVEVSVKEVEVK